MRKIQKLLRPWKAKNRVFLLSGVLILLVASGYAGYRWLFTGMPDTADLSRYRVIPSVRIEDRNGRLLYEMMPDGGARHQLLSIDQIPETMLDATVSTEDASFYSNPGFDISGILRAVWINLRGGETISGGSTITQQVARNLLFTPEERSERTLRRKLREAWLAWELTRIYGKDKILELYLNQSYFGGMAYGVEAASQTYFGKPASQLDLAESALLAGLIQAPGLYNPFTDPEAAKERQKVVLELMEKHQAITAEQRLWSEAEPLVYASTPYPIEAPHFVMMVLAELDQALSQETILKSPGIIVRTTLDLDWQQHAEAIARRQLQALNDPPAGEASHNVNNAALVALDPHSGEVLALMGSPDYFNAAISGAVNMALAPVQPGSALKPVIYAANMDPNLPNPWTAATMILDVRTTFQTHSGKPYTPVNYDSSYHGPVLVRDALGSSLNIPAVAALDHAGLEQVIRLSRKLGITTFSDPNQYDLSLALGGGAVRLIELTAAYGAFASGGDLVTPTLIIDVQDISGEGIYKPAVPARPQVLDERVAWLITDMLSDDLARAIGFGLNSALRLDRPAAAKTGTTTDFHDNWTIGYTPDLVVGVWVGNASHEAMREITGITGAGPIWHEFMRTALAGTPKASFMQPPGLEEIEVCALSGLLPTPNCPYRKYEWFIEGTQPREADNFYQVIQFDALDGKLADEQTLPEHQRMKLVLDLPQEAWSWARENGIAILHDYAQSVSSSWNAALRITSPDPNTTYFLTPSLPAETQKIRVAVEANLNLSEVTIYIDDLEAARCTTPTCEVWWALSVGDHQVRADGTRTDGSDVSAEVVSFTVRDK